MFGLFKKKTEQEKLQEEYENLMSESYRLSRTDRRAGDLKRAEADELLKKIDGLRTNSSQG